MRISLKVFLSIALVLICPVNTSFSASPEDLEGSGYDLDSSASGSGDWSDEDENKYVWTLARNAGDDAKDGSSVMIFEQTQWPTRDSYVILANRKNLLENTEIRAGLTAGGVAGVILAVTLAAILIYKWQKKDDEGYITGQRRTSDEDYQQRNRDEFVLV